jgi:cell division protein FtsI/penicillin-binding protein 2
MRHLYSLRILAVYLLFCGLFAALGHHLYRLQVVRHGELRTKAEAKYLANQTAMGKRGMICDVNGNLLVGNQACKDVRADLSRIKPERQAHVIETLHRELGVDLDVLRQRFASGRKEIVILDGVELAVADRLAALKLPGVRLVDADRRHYPKKQLLANVLGFTQRESRQNAHLHVGVTGVEAVFNKELSPRYDTVTYARDRKGRPLHRAAPQEPEVLDGRNVYLTIHEPIQHIVETELRTLMENHAPQYAYAILADPHTGAILAMAQCPSFDPNQREAGESKLWVNHFVSDVYDPGSAIKGLVIAGAIDYRTTNLGKRYDCEDGYWFYGGKILRDSGHRYGTMNTAQIIQKSSNIGTAKIAMEMGDKRLYQLFRRWGFGERTHIGLPAESRGILRPLANWDKLSITRMPIGQGISVTPLQMVQAYCALANGGTMMQLHLVDRIEDPATGEVIKTEPVVKHSVIREHAARDANSALMLVTQEGGTATRAAVKGYDVAGKTGTAQKLVDGTYNSGKYVSSFIGFVPATNPAFVLLLVADEPSKEAYYGGTVCGPSFSRIAEQTLRYLNVPPTHPLPPERQAVAATTRKR